MFKWLVCIMIMFSLNANANESTKSMIKKVEGFSGSCQPDNWQISGGYGSQFLCKQNHRRLFNKKISVEEANKQLDNDYLAFKNQVINQLRKTNNNFDEKIMYKNYEVEAIIIATYQKGIGNIIKQRFFEYLMFYKLKQMDVETMVKQFLKLSCVYDAKTHKKYASKGIFKRHYATAQLFIGNVKNMKDFTKYHNSFDSIKYNEIDKYCKSSY